MEPFRHHGQTHSHHHHNNHHNPSVTVQYCPSPAEIKGKSKKALARPSIPRVIIRLAALAISVSALAIGVSALAVLAQSVIVWFATHDTIVTQPQGLRMRAWPDRLEMAPTYVMLGAALISVVVQILAGLTLCGKVCYKISAPVFR